MTGAADDHQVVDRRQHNFDRRQTDVVAKALAERVKTLEEWAHNIDFKVTEQSRNLAENTDLTRDIKHIAETVRDAVQGAGALWQFLSKWAGRLKRWSFATAKWVAAVAGAFAAVHAALKGWTNIDIIEWLRGVFHAKP